MVGTPPSGVCSAPGIQIGAEHTRLQQPRNTGAPLRLQPLGPMRYLLRHAARLALVAGIVAISATASTAQARTGAAARDSAEAAATVERFHRALAAGDSTGALALLTQDAMILEAGGVETRAEYRSHHLSGDIEFARAIRSERGPVRVKVRGDVAWATSTSTTQGEFKGRAINSAGAELMVLTRTPTGWRIASVHWSSRTRRT